MAGQGAAEIVALLGMQRHPEGGWYVETFRDAAGTGGRAASTAIYFLLEQGDVSAWHRVRDAVEVWHFHAGAPIELTLFDEMTGRSTHRLGADLAAGERPQVVVPADAWQTAHSLGDWTLVGCTVAPGFEFSAFELAPEGWEPG
ncbi:cupin domain-containing protein [Kumtagia ephedrae]|uniref:Cupin n=1 Tax=Kumtagia ephedrae TaxID=2116701 RepID=A0A2P7RJV9_9HYPH|nr:cupin domain-containing protein [Mesorhizobium ephedrae]PSJ50496.1 cupin [Mesorhizobium ephedrae]